MVGITGRRGVHGGAQLGVCLARGGDLGEFGALSFSACSSRSRSCSLALRMRWRAAASLLPTVVTRPPMAVVSSRGALVPLPVGAATTPSEEFQLSLRGCDFIRRWWSADRRDRAACG